MYADMREVSLGPGPQPLRGIPGFPGQPPQNRNAPLGAGRLQNGKLGTQLGQSETAGTRMADG